MPLLLLLLFVAGCAAPTQSTYSQAVPNAFPAPPMAPVGRGAPVVGQPGQPDAQQPQYPRGPHTRPLPPTAGPGLWAGDEPRASRSRPAGPPEVLGVPLPFASEDPTEEEERPTRACANMLGTVLPKVNAPERVVSLTPAQRRCLAARLYEECSLALQEVVEGTQDGTWAHNPRELRIHAAVVEAAKRFEREACEGVVPSIAAKSLREAVKQQWSREPWGKP